jgi:WD repeat-containing protein 19
MLGRVVESLSEFPKHTVMILTTAVIESYRSGMKKKAFEYASTLMRQEYRGDIPEKYKKKIESIVRKHKSTIEDPEEQATFSPYDSTVRVPVTELMCPTTRQEIPFCICTGYHVVADDMCICPNSKMPAIYSEYVSWIESNGTDPITDKPVNLSDVRRLSDPTDFLDSYNKIEEEQEEEGKKDSEK